jgi:hypothetical protein
MPQLGQFAPRRGSMALAALLVMPVGLREGVGSPSLWRSRFFIYESRAVSVKPLVQIE